jgi:hypothetical protein
MRARGDWRGADRGHALPPVPLADRRFRDFKVSGPLHSVGTGHKIIPAFAERPACLPTGNLPESIPPARMSPG